jgi:hypothetical protein
MSRVRELSSNPSATLGEGDPPSLEVTSEIVHDVVLGAVAHETADRWRLSLPGEDPIEEDVWTPDLVEKRLVDAIRLRERTMGRVAPRAYGTGSPNYLHDAMDRWFQQMQEEEERRANAAERNRVRLGATAAEVANADYALLWPISYLRSDLKALVALNCFLFAKAKRLKSWQRYAERQGVPRATAKRHKARAIVTICLGLAEDSIPVGRTR